MTESMRMQWAPDAGRLPARKRVPDRWPAILAGSIVASTVIHAVVLMAWPSLEVPASLYASRRQPAMIGVQVVAPASALRRPLPPRDITRPAVPVLPVLHGIETDVAMASVPAMPAFDRAQPIDLPPLPGPPAEAARDAWSSYETFSPVMVKPDIVNRDEVTRFLERRYQPILRSTGATGVVMMSFWIDEEGRPQRAEIARSSGNKRLDETALKLAEKIRFSPAIRAGKPIRVKVDVPIRFQER